MSSQDEYRKKAVHKSVDSNRNIKKVIIPHKALIGKKSNSVNKDTVAKVSGSKYEANLTIRDDSQDWCRLELNNGKSTNGSVIKFNHGGEYKGYLSQYNQSHMYLETFVNDLHIIANDGIAIDAKGNGAHGMYLKTKSSTRLTITQDGYVGIGTVYPSTIAHVYGGNLRIGDRATFGGSATTSAVERARIEMVANDNSGNVQVLLDARDSSGARRGQLGTLSNHDMMIFTNNTSAIRVDNNQLVGIGTDDPSRKLHVVQSKEGSYIALFDNSSTDTSADGIAIQLGPDAEASHTVSNSFIFFLDGNGDTVGRIRSDSGGGGVSIAASFTGAHVTILPSEDFEMGLIVDSTGDMWANHIGSVSTALPSVALSSDNESNKVYGVLSEKDSHHGMVKRWGLPEGMTQVYVNALGEGKVWVTNKSGAIMNGDYITTSVIPGHGMKQSDGILRNYTVAKCVESVDWESVSDTVMHNGIEYKKYLIGCTYHCG